jgi:hypothetical protein
MKRYPPQFYRHRLAVRPRTWSQDGSLGEIATVAPAPDPSGWIPGNMQDNPTHGERMKSRDETHDATQSNRSFRVFADADPQINVQDTVDVYLKSGVYVTRLTAISKSSDRGGFGAYWLFDAVEIK